LNGISVDTVKKTEKSGLSKIRETKEFSDLKKDMNGEAIVQDGTSDDDYKIYR
jgi:hypothetical protein